MLIIVAKLSIVGVCEILAVPLLLALTLGLKIVEIT